MSMTQQLPPLKAETLQQQFAALNAFVRSAAREGTPSTKPNVASGRQDFENRRCQ